MAEEATRFKHFEYRSNQNYVLQALHKKHRPTTDANGEPTSLVGRITHRMGDMHREVMTAERRTEVSKAEKKRKREARMVEGPRTKRMKLLGPASVLASDALDGIHYQPKKRETRQAYQELLSAVQVALGDQPASVVMSAADEVLALLKDENIRPAIRQRDIQLILGNLNSERYNQLIKIAKQITDYNDASQAASSSNQGAEEIMEDEDAGVAVLVGESDSDDVEFEDEEDEDDEDETGEDTGPLFKQQLDADGNEVIETQFEDRTLGNGMDVDDKPRGSTPVDELERTVDPHDIDAYWLQRQVGTHLQVDHETSASLAKQILPLLAGSDLRAVESELLELLDIDQFKFVKFITMNKLAIYYCTRLLQAQSDSERSAIETEMKQDPHSNSLLLQLRNANKGSKYASLTIDPVNTRGANDRSNSMEGVQPYAFQHRANTTVDLEALAFQNGSHLMTNKKCVLPPGSKSFTTKEYKEVLIPATRSTAADSMPRFPIADMPEWSKRAFAGMEFLNPVQTQLRAAAFETSENLLLCAPTGAGKTNVAMLCMLHEIGLHYDPKTDTVDLDAFKIVYVAPMKSLVQEMVHNFGKRLAGFGISVRELSGDSSLTKAQVNATQVIITTPEKWDIITRKTGDRTFTELVKLVIIDEIHLLHDERGPVLESIVARTVRQIESTQNLIRLVGLSATLPNYEDVATFLRVKPENLFAFKNIHRPIPLEQSYVGITTKKPFKRFQIMNQVCYEKMLSMAGEQMLIFVHSRKETAKTAKALRDMAIEKGTLSQLVRDNDAITREILIESAQHAKNADLKDLLPYGFAIHHAGMHATDRSLVEDLFENKKIQVLISTATLAWGVNLPAHAVIIKGTQIYNAEKGGWMELSSMDVMQMLGRAGRPQYDTKGVGIVITSHDELQFYLSLLNHQLPIESQYITRLADNLNAEVVLGTVQTMRDAVEWLGYTYLYVCMLRNPGLYGISAEQLADDPYLEQRRTDLIHTVALQLAKTGVLKYDRKAGTFQSTDIGRIASHYYIPHQSIATYNEHLKPTTGEIELLRIFSLSKEFTNIAVRQDERLELERLVDQVPVPVKESIDEPAAKINVLLQAHISQLRLEGFSLMSDMVYVTQSASRIMRCLFEITLKKGWAQVAERCLNYCKMIEKRLWLSQSPLRQFKNIPQEALRKIETKELTLDRLYSLNSKDIGDMIRYPALAKSIHQAVHQCPKLDISPTIQPLTRSLLQVELTITPDFEFVESVHSKSQPFWILVIDVDGETILHSELFTLKQKYSSQEHFVAFTVPMFETTPPQYFIKILSDRFITFETVKPISFRHLIPPDRFPEPKPLLDLPPLDLTHIESQEFRMALLPTIRSDLALIPSISAKTLPSLVTPLALEFPASTIKNFDFADARFNHIQTQVFQAFHNSDSNVILCAPGGSGKILCAELALMRELSNPQHGNIVFICGTVERLPILLRDFQARYPKRTISALTGEAALDVKLLDASDMVLATPQQWDSLSRRWKQRSAVQKVSLFIVESLQQLGSGTASGVALEVIVSRMRYMSKQLKMQAGQGRPSGDVRFVGLGSCIANVNNFADWLGVTTSNCFNFHPQVRPIPVEISLQSFESPDQSSLQLSMTRPLLHAVSRYATSDEKGQSATPTLIFTPSRKMSRLITLDLMTYMQAENTPQRFLHVSSEEELTTILSAIENPLLKDALIQGIGFINESLLEREICLVKNLFSTGRIQILIANRQFAFGLDVRAKFVAIVGTQYYEGKEHRYVDYSINELLQMVSFSGRQVVLGASSSSSTSSSAFDTSCRCIIMCHQKKREFYKKFLADPVPVESHLEAFLHDHLNAEIYTKVIENKQETLDYLTWTFYYRRLPQNPNYYGLQGISHTHLSDKVSELMDETLGDLEQAKAIIIEDDTDISILNAGAISAFYYIRYTTIELFNSSLTEKTKMRGLIEIMANASEFEDLPIRHKEDRVLAKLAMHLPVKIERPDYFSTATKVNILLQAHFSRRELPIDLMEDQKQVLAKVPELLQAMVDIISTSGWLGPCIAAMELSQMVVQAVWDSESVFRQLPHFSSDLIARLTKMEPECETIFDLLGMDDQRRNSILQLSKREMADVARVCNRFPNIEVQHQLSSDTVASGSKLSLLVKLERELDEGETSVGPVHAPFFPKKKVENWWLIVGDQKENKVFVVKRIPVANASQTIKLDFNAPEKLGPANLTLSLIADSWIGCDQEYDIEFEVTEAEEAEDEE
jgi:pre-mRNA-splicing helicase BRR2